MLAQYTVYVNSQFGIGDIMDFHGGSGFPTGTGIVRGFIDPGVYLVESADSQFCTQFASHHLSTDLSACSVEHYHPIRIPVYDAPQIGGHRR